MWGGGTVWGFKNSHCQCEQYFVYCYLQVAEGYPSVVSTLDLEDSVDEQVESDTEDDVSSCMLIDVSSVLLEV